MFGRLRADGQQRDQGRIGWRVVGGGVEAFKEICTQVG